ncbi:MAG: hypothetical protein WBQ72_00465 [Terriglobales bacterium]|jgi:hypothetical protein
MKNVCKLATLILMMLAVSVLAFSQQQEIKETAALNLVRGVIGPVGSNTSWSGYSVLNVVPGAGLIPISSSNTVFYLGFTAGSQADVSNMVLYTTARSSSTITAVTPVKYGGVSNPSIVLSNTSVCPVQPLSASTPCIVRLDPTSLALSALNDYYLVIYFTPSDANDGQIGATQPTANTSSILGWYIGNADYTGLSVGQSIPTGCCRVPDFLMYVMSN